LDAAVKSDEWRDVQTLEEIVGTSSILPEEFYRRSTTEVAHDLLGKTIVHRSAAGRIVEVEAYLGLDDLAAHASAGITARTRVLFGPPGRAYVYLIYGMHECLNLVAEPDGRAGCVLIRALEPLCGVAAMRRRRPAARHRTGLCSGPGKLTSALAVTRALNGANVTVPGPLEVRAPSRAVGFEMVTSTRIGIRECTDWPLRFYVRGNAYVSRTPGNR
jgi:DNA-3-methyladenine glycosylase